MGNLSEFQRFISLYDNAIKIITYYNVHFEKLPLSKEKRKKYIEEIEEPCNEAFKLLDEEDCEIFYRYHSQRIREKWRNYYSR